MTKSKFVIAAISAIVGTMLTLWIFQMATGGEWLDHAERELFRFLRALTRF